MGSSSRTMTEEERALLENIVMEMHSRFVDIVSEGRGMPREEVVALADGRIYTGEQSLDNGLVDSLGYFDDAVEAAEDVAGISEAKVVKYQRKVGLSELILSMSNKGRGISSLLDTESLLNRNAPSLMYLWAPVLNGSD